MRKTNEEKIMQQLLEKLINVNELDLRKSLKTAATVGLLGAAAFGVGKYASTNTKQLVKPIKTTSTIVQLNKDTESSVDVEAFLKNQFLDEYDIIKKAATRNNISGDDLFILFAIRKAENGSKGNEFGIMHKNARNTNLDTQAGWASATIIKNRKRHKDSGSSLDFITFLGNRYAPIGVENDPGNLNKNWIKNVKYWKRKLEQ